MTRRASIACAVSGAGWVALIGASAMVDAGALSYDGYYRVMAVPLLLFLVAWLALRAAGRAPPAPRSDPG